jgi:hypothetical protein
VIGEHATILVAWVGDGWPARRQQFGYCGDVGEQRREDLGEEGADRRAPSIIDGGAVMGWQAGSLAKMLLGRLRFGPATEIMTHDDFFHFQSFFQMNKSAGENKNRKNTWEPQENVKFCMEIDLNIFHNFCIGHFDQRSTILK